MLVKIFLYICIICYLIYGVYIITNGKKLKKHLLNTPIAVILSMLVEAVTFQLVWNNFTPLIYSSTIMLDFWSSLKFIFVFNAVKFVIKISFAAISSFFVK